jgi:hypothetical protein
MKTIDGSHHAAIAVLAIAGLAACVPAVASPDDAADPALAEQAAATTAPMQPIQIVFDWSLRERDARFSGRGSARVAPTYQARLDLFGPRGETYLAAALIGTELRLAATGNASAELPPPELLWTVLGVFHAPENAQLLRSTDDGTTLRLEYGLGGERWRYRFTNGRLVHAEWEAGRASRRTVELRGAAEYGLPREALYRDHAEFRELTLTLDQVYEVDAFPPDIFVVGR